MFSQIAAGERKLLFWTALVFIFGVGIIELQKYPHMDTAMIFKEAGFVVFLFIFQLILRRVKPDGDKYLFPLITALFSMGLIMIYRLMPKLFASQLMWIALGFIVFLGTIILFRKLAAFAHYKYLIGLIGVVMLLAAILFGTEIGGSRSWIILGPIRFQPSEFAKIFIILFLGGYLVEHKAVLLLKSWKLGPIHFPAFRFIAPLIAIWSLAIMMFLLQRDLGSALIFFGIAVSMTYMANGNMGYVSLATLFFSVGSTISYFFFSHVRVRVAIWQNPWADPNGQAYQIIQSLLAIGSGGILGSGLTYGHPDFIPEVHTDFIFSAIAEELGFAGAAAIILLYMLLIYRGFKIAMAVKDEMEMLVAAGISAAIALQVFTIIAGVTKFIPLTGITMPFISYGGSSVMTNFIMMGILFSLSGKRHKQ